MDNKDLTALWLLPLATVSIQVYAVDYLSAAETQKIIFPEANAFVDHKIHLTSEQKDRIKKLSGAIVVRSEPAGICHLVISVLSSLIYMHGNASNGN